MDLSSIFSKNTFWLFSGQIIIKIVAFFYTVFLARLLGASDFGLYVAALAYFSLISSISDFGFNRFLMRDISQDKNRASYYLGNVLILRALLTLGSFLIFTTFLFFFDGDAARRNLSILAVFAIIPNGLAVSFDAAFVALEKMKYSALAIIFLNGSSALLGFLAVLSGLGVFGVIFSLVLAHFIYFAILFLFLEQQNIHPVFTFNLAFWQKSLKESLPYAVIIILGLIYFKIDTLMLSYMKGSEVTGFYGAAYKFLDAVYFIPLVFVTALFPKISRLHLENLEELKSVYYNAVKTLFLISLPVTGILFFGAQTLIYYLYGPVYEPSIMALQILAFTVIFMFSNTPSVHFLMASSKFLKSIIFLSCSTVAFNIILNLILIPRFSLIGASFVTLISEIISFFAFFFLARASFLKPKTIKINEQQISA